MEEYVIVNATEEHLDGLELLEQQCFSLPWTREQLRSQLPDARHVFLVLCRGEKVVGYVGMMHVLDEGYISNVAVSPAYRRKGLGERLIQTLMEKAEELSLAFVSLEVRASNLPAISLYEKYRFKKVGLRKKYYDLPKEDAIIMSRFLK